MFSDEQINSVLDNITDKAKENLLKDKRLDIVGFAFNEVKGIAFMQLTPLFALAERIKKAGMVDTSLGLRTDVWDAVRHGLREAHAYGVVIVSECSLLEVPRKDVDIMYGEEPGKARVTARHLSTGTQREAISIYWEFRREDGQNEIGVRFQFFLREGAEVVLEEMETKDDGLILGLSSRLLD